MLQAVAKIENGSNLCVILVEFIAQTQGVYDFVVCLVYIFHVLYLTNLVGNSTIIA